MTQIRAAVEALHASREALPDEGRRWSNYGSPPFEVYVDEDWGDDDAPVVVIESASVEHAHLISLVASPHVVEALEQLLTAIHEHDQADDPHSWETCFIDVRHNADALAAALTRRTA